MQQAFAYMHNVPSKQVFLAVVKPASYRLATDGPVGKLIEMAQESEITIREDRASGSAKGAVSFAAPRWGQPTFEKL